MKNYGTELVKLYENNGLFAKIIDTPAEEAMRNGFKVNGIQNGEILEYISESLDMLNWEEKAATALKWARLFGGSIAVMLINDGGGLEDPVDWENIKSIDDINVFDRSIIYSPKAEEPDFFEVTGRFTHFTVHRSRCMIFKNSTLPEIYDNSIYQNWGLPEFLRIKKAMHCLEHTHESTVKALERFTQPVYRMKGLSEGLAIEEGEKHIWKRLEAIDNARSLYNSVMIDIEEDYGFLSAPLTGISEIVEASQVLLSAVSCIPRRILFGKDSRKNAAGISMQHSADKVALEMWYNYVESMQMRMIEPNLSYLLQIFLQAAYNTGEIDEIPNFSVKFCPLWSMSEDEKATAKYKKALANLRQAETERTYYQIGAITKKEIRSNFDIIF